VLERLIGGRRGWRLDAPEVLQRQLLTLHDRPERRGVGFHATDPLGQPEMLPTDPVRHLGGPGALGKVVPVEGSEGHDVGGQLCGWASGHR
jgi:hypothetical protein